MQGLVEVTARSAVDRRAWWWWWMWILDLDLDLDDDGRKLTVDVVDKMSERRQKLPRVTPRQSQPAVMSQSHLQLVALVVLSRTCPSYHSCQLERTMLWGYYLPWVGTHSKVNSLTCTTTVLQVCCTILLAPLLRLNSDQLDPVSIH